jgi:hypothetical protein
MADTLRCRDSMSNQDLPLPVKPKLSSEERRARQADRLAALRLRLAIGRELEDRGITNPTGIGDALGMPALEAAKLLARHQWRDGDVALLEAAAARLGVQVAKPVW